MVHKLRTRVSTIGGGGGGGISWISESLHIDHELLNVTKNKHISVGRKYV